MCLQYKTMVIVKHRYKCDGSKRSAPNDTKSLNCTFDRRIDANYTLILREFNNRYNCQSSLQLKVVFPGF